MSRFFIRKIPFQDQDMIISEADETHHLLRVLRLKPGDKVELIDGQGTLACGAISRIVGLDVSVHIQQRLTMMPKEQGRIILACALPKKAKFETILEKCTELGVDEIIPMITERTEVRPHASGGKDARFSKVIVNASKQSKRLFFPVLHPVMTFEDVLAQFISSQVAVFIPWLEGDRVPLKDAVSASSKANNFLVLIGPEGDFTPDEVARAQKQGAVAITLGENTLKVDTAAMAVVSAIRLLL